VSVLQLALRNAAVSFGGRPLFQGISLAVAKADRICLVGRNGSGKSTLLKALAGLIDLDAGERFVLPGITVSYMPQEVTIAVGLTIADHVAGGLAEHAEGRGYRVQQVLDQVGLDGARPAENLSGGEERRASLARALVSDPDILLLDEPTNHLDLPTVEWLEQTLAAYRGGLVLISHDRAFLTRLSNQTCWLDRGRLLRHDQGFASFDSWSEAILAAEEAEQAKLDKRILSETAWSRAGISARRKRNQGRLRQLQQMRRDRAARVGAPDRVRLVAEAGEASGRLVAEAEHLSKRFGETIIVRDFSTRIVRGDRIGLIGPNGAGKTTLLKLLTGELAPDSGTLKLGNNLRPVWFDQRRASLDPEATLWQTLCPAGGDQVMVQGRPRHVASYLRDFLFEDRQLLAPVKTLSGGERNRLLLARILAQPSNLLVLDEPTNDLDMDTLDMLQEVLADYDGTLLLVSHDRDFLDRLVTSVIAVEGQGRTGEYVGGYQDYLRQRPAAVVPAGERAVRRPTVAAAPARPQKLSYKDQRELDLLPGHIAALEQEIRQLETDLADAELYARDPRAFAKAVDRLSALRRDLAAAEERWLDLETRREAMSGA